MASVIAMSCTECEMVQGAEMMLHNPWSMLAGDAKDLRKAADHLDQLREGLVARYTKRLGDADTVRKMLDEETWLTAEKAVEIGAADRIKAGTPVRMALMSNLATKHQSPFLIAASADPYAAKLQAEIQKHVDLIAKLEGEKATVQTELENAILSKSQADEAAASVRADLDALQTERNVIAAKLDAIEKDAARQAALAGTVPVAIDLIGSESGEGLTAYEKYKSIQDPSARRDFYKRNANAIFQTTPKG